MENLLSKMISSLFLVFIGLTTGYLVQQLINKTTLKSKFSIVKIRRFLQKTILQIIIPLTVVGSIWVAPLRHLQIISLPFLGALAVLLGGSVGYIMSKPLGLNREQRGVFTVTSGFTNMGSLGGLFVFILLGEKGFALVAFYQLFEKIMYFGIGFPLAKAHSSHRESEGSSGTLIQSLKDPVIVINLAAILLGGILNLTGVQRPDFYFHINRIFVPLGSLGLLISIGLAMKFSSMRNYWKPGMMVILIKSVIIPTVIFGLGYILGLGNIEDGLVLKFLLIISAMPVGFIALVPPTLYDMDLDLANTCWFFSTISLVVSVPVISLILPLIG